MVTAAEKRLDKIEETHEECQKERIELSVMVRQIHAKLAEQGEDEWSKHAMMVMKAIDDLEASVEKANSRIWKLVIAVLMLALGVIASAVKAKIGG